MTTVREATAARSESMRGSGSAAGAGGSGRAEWQRIYDRVEAQVEELTAGRSRLEAINRIQHEFWDARDKINQALLHQAELGRSRWEAACRELLPGDSPKLAVLLGIRHCHSQMNATRVFQINRITSPFRVSLE